MTNKVPNIRFKGFTDDWEQRKLGEIAERVQGNDGRMDLPTLTISAANGWMDQKERFSGNIAGKEQKKYTLLHKGELSYNHGNSKLAKYGTVFSLETYEEALVPRVYHSFKVINGSSKFIEYYFATKIPDRELAKLVSSGARMDGLLNINFNEFMGINLIVPNKSEQEKISNYFSNLDRLITLHQRKCEQTKELKKFMLQKMFPKKGEKNPEIRFPGFTDDWEQRKLGEVVEDYIEKTTVEDQYPVLTSSQQKGIVLQEEYFAGNRVSQNGNIGYFVIPRGYFAFRSRSDNDTFVFNRNDAVDMGIISYFYPVFKPKGVDSDFLLRRLNYGLENQIKINSEGTGQHVLSLKKFKNMIGSFPSYEEQQKIGEYFSKLDNLITLHQRKCEQLKELKKFMLQNMFPKKG